MPLPNTKVELQKFLGCVNFYHKFLPKLATILAPLHNLTASVDGQKSKLLWTEQQRKAFSDAKDSLANAVLLVHPDPEAPISLTTDASDVAVGAVLSQGRDTKQAPLGFFSKKLSGAELNYSTFDRELLGVFLAVKHFQQYLEGRKFTIYTDHKPLCGAIVGSTTRSPRQARHLSYIAEFSTDLQHLPGPANVVADALSRPAEESTRTADPTTKSTTAIASPQTVAAASTVLTAQIDWRELAKSQREAVQEFEQLMSGKTSLKVETVKHSSGVDMLCDVSNSRPRPLVPRNWTRKVFDVFHGLSHPGARITLDTIRRSFVWYGMSTQIKTWARSCQSCQQAKISQHVKAPYHHRPPPDRRFASLHVDLVGPLPECRGYRYLFTIIDRYTRWMEVIPLVTMTATDCATALVENWIARYGVPTDIVTDQGRQFISTIWVELLRSLGIISSRTTPYHPQSNGMVERMHRTLKERLMSRRAGVLWMDHLPAVMMGLRASVREDAGVSPAELVFGMPFRLPGIFFHEEVQTVPGTPTSEFVDNLRRTMADQTPAPVVHHSSLERFRLPADLLRAEFVYLRVGAVRAPLVPPYEGPFRVVQPGQKTFVINRAGKNIVVSVDRLKSALVCLSDPTRDSAGKFSSKRDTTRSGATSPTSPALASPSSTQLTSPTKTNDMVRNEKLVARETLGRDGGFGLGRNPPRTGFEAVGRTRCGRRVRPPHRLGIG